MLQFNNSKSMVQIKPWTMCHAIRHEFIDSFMQWALSSIQVHFTFPQMLIIILILSLNKQKLISTGNLHLIMN